MIDLEIEWDNPMLYVVWMIGEFVMIYMLKTLNAGSVITEGNPEYFTVPKLIMMGVIGTILLFFVAVLFINKGSS